MFSKSLLKSFGVHAREHYPNCSYGVYPIENDSAVAIVLVANRYSPNNFWWVVTSLQLISWEANRYGRFPFWGGLSVLGQ